MLEINALLRLLGYTDSPHFRIKESQFEPESVHYFRLAKGRPNDKFSVKGFYVFNTAKNTAAPFPARPAVCVAEAPTAEDARKLHRRIWNLGNVPFVIARMPNEIRVYSGFRYEENNDSGLLLHESSESKNHLRSKLSDFTSHSIDSARIWQAQKEHLDTRHRVDRTLLENLGNLAQALNAHCVPKLELAVAHALIGKFVYLRYLRDRNILDDEWLEKRKINLEEVFGPQAT